MTYSGFDIANKVVLVTGGTSGIGRTVALAYAKAGAKVMAGSTNPEKVSAIKSELGSAHDAIQIDVANPDSARRAVEATVKRFGRIDALFNAAGVIKKQPSLDVSLEEFERVVRINLTGTFVIAQAVARAMKDQSPDAKGERGSMVFIASLNSYVSLSEVLAYAASKSGVMGLTRGLANEWAQYGIRVNGIAPGVFPTDLNRPLIEGTARGAWLKQHTPMARFGDADEIAGAAIYLISDSASYVTGETIIIDGGFLAHGV